MNEDASQTQDAAKPWIDHYPKGLAWDAALPDNTVLDALASAVSRFGAQPCLDFFGRVTSYREVAAEVDRVTRGLQDLGVGPGWRVGILLPNMPQFVITYYAVLKAGATVVNFNPLYTAEKIGDQIENSKTRLIVTLDMKEILPKALAALGQGTLERVVVCNLPEALPFFKALAFRLFKSASRAPLPADDRVISWSRLRASEAAPSPVALDPERDIAVIQYTGGTTGHPKGVLLTHRNIAVNAQQVRLWSLDHEDGDETLLGVLPLFHVFAMTVVMNLGILAGARLILVPRFELKVLLDLIEKKRPSIFPGVPTIFNAINNAAGIEGRDLKSLKFCISGGAPLPVEVKTRFEALTGCLVVEGYGQSETSPVVTCNPADSAGKAGSVGQPIPGTRVEIRDLEDPHRTVPLGERGEVCMAGPQVMAGYLDRPDATSEVFLDDLLRSGDVGYMDEEGYVFLVDRIKDLIICSGYKVYPRNIEDAIYEHDAVEEATVVGVPDDYRGEAPKAFVKVKAGETLTEADLLAFLKDKLSPIEMPGAVAFRDALPKTMIGKLSKKELEAEAKEKSEKRHS